MTQSLPTGVYGSILQGYFGGLSNSGKSYLWTQFLQSQGLPTTSTPAPTAGLESQFIDFLEGSASATAGGLSPTEVARRKLYATVITQLIQLMKQLQNSDVVQNALNLFYTQYQAQYTNMMAAVPVYMGSDNVNTWVPSTDPSQFTFGYDNISITNIADYLANSQIKTGSATFQLQTASLTAPAASYVMGTNSSGGLPYLKVNAGDNINLQYTVSQVNGVPQVTLVLADNSQPSGNNSFSSIQLGTFTGTAPTTATQADWSTAFSDVMETAFQAPMQANGELQTTVPPSANGWVRNSPLSTTQTSTGGTITWSGDDSLFYGGTEGPPGWGTGTSGGFPSGVNLWLNSSSGSGFPNVPSGPVIVPSRQGDAGQTVYQFGPISIPWRYNTEEIPGAWNDPNNPDGQIAFLSADSVVQEAATANQELTGFIENLKAQQATIQNNAQGVIGNIQSSNSSIQSNVGVINSALQELKTILDGIFS